MGDLVPEVLDDDLGPLRQVHIMGLTEYLDEMVRFQGPRMTPPVDLLGVGLGREPSRGMYEPSPVMSRWDKEVPERYWAEVRFRVGLQRLVRRGVFGSVSL